MEVKFKNFKIRPFLRILAESLLCNTELVLHFDKDVVKSFSVARSGSVMKLNSFKLSDFCTPENLDFKPFNFFIFQGDIFIKNVKVFNGEVDITVDIDTEVENQFSDCEVFPEGTSITIEGKTQLNSPLSIKLPLTLNGGIDKIVKDYQRIIKHCTPYPECTDFVLNKDIISEIHSLSKVFKKSTTINSQLLNFEIDVENNAINISDTIVKKLSFPLNSKNKPTSNFSFSIGKNDLFIAGIHEITFLTTPDPNGKVSLIAQLGPAILNTTILKPDQTSVGIVSAQSEMMSGQEPVDVSEYFGDDLPF